LGLRGLLVLGAGPGVGKTTYGLQLGLSVCKNNADAVFLMISLEMDRWAMYTRLLCNLAQLDWKTVMLGSASCRKSPNGPWFTPADQQSLDLAKAQLKDGKLGKQVLVVDRTSIGDKLTAASVQRLLDGLKKQCSAKRALVVIDYIQRISVSADAAKRGDLEADRYRVQVVQDIAEATKTASNPAGDAVLVISETRKPSGGAWYSKLADLMGSARLPYAVDAALLYRPMVDDDEVAQYSWPSAGVSVPSIDDLNKAGIAPVRLEIAKGRDGMQHGSWAMAFHYQQSRFVEAIVGMTAAGFHLGVTSPDPGEASEGPEADPGAGINPFV
jgi:replicative DNA helicase